MFNILIVEDHELTRFGLKTAFESCDFIDKIYEAESAEKGLEIATEQEINLIIMDLGLPGMNGIEAMVKCKEMHFESKIIALTSHDRSEEVLAALTSGASAYCLKDIDPNKLADVVRDVSTGVCWIDPMVAQMTLNSLPKVDNVGILPNKSHAEGCVPLTEREFEVLKHLVSGKSNTEIAKELIVSVHTAKAHVCSILQKMCVNDRVQAAVKAVKEGMV